MALFIGDTAPNFKATTQLGEIDFHEFIGDHWCIFFSHPKDFTPVCTTELGFVAKLEGEWKKRNTKVLALSVDSAEEHVKWIKDIESTQHTHVNYPVIADPTRKIAETFGMLDKRNINKEGLPETVRSVFVIDPAKTIRLIITYPASCGRNFDEIVRVLDSLQLATKCKTCVTPVNWKQGEDVIIKPSVSDEDATKQYGEFRKELPYLRYAKCPK
jgi:alkyl hydroperoxide reductase subunit AhpC